MNNRIRAELNGNWRFDMCYGCFCCFLFNFILIWSWKFQVGMRRTKHIRTVHDASLTALMVMMTLSASIHAIPSGQKCPSHSTHQTAQRFEAPSSRKVFHFITNGNNLNSNCHISFAFLCVHSLGRFSAFLRWPFHLTSEKFRMSFFSRI